MTIAKPFCVVDAHVASSISSLRLQDNPLLCGRYYMRQSQQSGILDSSIEDNLITTQERRLMSVFFLGGAYGTASAASKATAALLQPVLEQMQLQTGQSSREEKRRITQMLEEDRDSPRRRAGQLPLTRWAPLAISNITCAVGRRGSEICTLRLASIGVSRTGKKSMFWCLALRIFCGKALGSDMSLLIAQLKKELGMWLVWDPASTCRLLPPPLRCSMPACLQASSELDMRRLFRSWMMPHADGTECPVGALIMHLFSLFGQGHPVPDLTKTDW